MDSSPLPPADGAAAPLGLAGGSLPSEATSTILVSELPSEQASTPPQNQQILMEEPRYVGEHLRLRLAWGKLLWLMFFLVILLAFSYVVPSIIERVQYAATRGQLRAEHELAKAELAGSPLNQLSFTSEMIAAKVAPSVVEISIASRDADVFDGTLPMRSLGRGRLQREGQGSGVIVDKQGFIVTNYHVIRDAAKIQVNLADGRKLEGKLVGVDPPTDIAVLRIEGADFIAADWADSDQAKVGSMVWAVGSPFGLVQSITSGILSAKHRSGLRGTPYQDFLQSDAAVNPGNSGGPLVDSHGNVLGVNTAIVGDSYQGISFAVPSNIVKEVVERIRQEGEVKRGWLGIAMDVVTDERAAVAKLAEPMGAYVSEVVSPKGIASPAVKAGILPGDIVIRWNGTDVKSPSALSNLVARTAIASVAEVVIVRDGQELTLQLTVGERPL